MSEFYMLKAKTSGILSELSSLLFIYSLSFQTLTKQIIKPADMQVTALMWPKGSLFYESPRDCILFQLVVK